VRDASIEAMRPGPASPTWKIHAERVVVLGWPRAILMQFAHPLIAAGVAEHSSFQTNRLAPLYRLHGTVRAMLQMTFGDDEAAADAAERINRIHDRVNGTLSEPVGPYQGATPYSAHDPNLLAWVHMTLLDTMPDTYELLVAPLSIAEKDAYCVESLGGARRLGIPDTSVPAAYADVKRIVAARLDDGSLAVTDTARRLAADVLRPSFPALPWPADRLIRLVTVGLLPPTLRDAYGLCWSQDDEAALSRWSRRFRRFARHAPAALRCWRASRQR
jgi:uncharacterized protein (DUF2236 family)